MTLFLAPNAALADNECGLQVGTTPIDCPSADYSPDGITYVSVGDLVLNLEPISAFGTSLGSGGLNISAGVLGDSLTVTTERIASARHTAPVVVDLLTQAGDISLDSSTSSVSFPDIQGNTSATEYGVRAISGSGSIGLNLGGVTATGTPGIAAVYAETGGAGSIDITTARNVSGRHHGIQALVNGTGDLTITASGGVGVSLPFSADVDLTVAGIDATTGTGLLTIDIVTGSGTISGGQINTAIRTDAGGDAVINVAAGRTVGRNRTSEIPLLDLTAVGETTINNAGFISTSGLAIRASGDTFVINNDKTTSANNDGLIRGSVDFTGLTGGYIFNNNAGATWDARQFSDLGAGELNNAGTVELGRGDVISAPGTTFTGTGESLLQIRAILDGGDQADCLAVTIAACLDLTGGATAGQTGIRILATFNPDPFADPVDRPVNPGIVLVDVGGGTSAADHFVLDPDSGTFSESFYAEDPVYGAVIDTGGLFDYALLYNPTNQQHVLTSVPQHEALEYAALIHESLSVWHTTSDAVAGRQADLRDGGQRGGWVRVFTDQTERNFKPSVTTHGNTFNYDRSYELDTRGVVAGYDMTADDSHVFGVHLGFMSTRLEHDDSPTVDETTFPSSVTFGVYGGWWNETGLTLDGTLNVNLLDIEHDVRDGLEDTRSNVITTGIRAEAGWRFPMSESFYVQPHVIAAYAYADVEKLDMRDYDAKFEDEQSMRAALGVRLGGGTDLSNDRFSRVKYWLTARAWEEYAEDGNVQFLTDGDPLVIEDDISGSFGEIGLGVEATNQEGNLSAYFSTGATFGGDADNYNVSIGARLNW